MRRFAHNPVESMWISYLKSFVSPRPWRRPVFPSVLFLLFTYNELPAFAVAKDCWFRARSFKDAPFFLVERF